MLVATTEQNERFVITGEQSLHALRHLRAQQTFYCPQCRYEVMLKVGEVRTPHFAHVRKTACAHMFAEAESDVHLRGKQQLYQFFNALRIDAELESTIAQLQQRPDLFIAHEGRSIAIEFQCSRIAAEQFIARTNGYLQHHIEPIWLLKTPLSCLVKGIHKMTLNVFERLFIRHYNERSYVLTYDPYREQFMYIQHLCHVVGNTYIVTVEPLALRQQRFPFYVPNAMSEQQFAQYMTLYVQMRQAFLRQRLRYSQQGVQDLFLRGIYEMRLVRERLPLFIGLPLHRDIALPVSPTEWQLLLFYFLHVHHIALHQLEQQHITHFLTWAKLACTEQMAATVLRYIKLLRQLAIEHPHTIVPQPTLFAALYRECYCN